MSVRVLIVDDREPFRLAARMVVDATEGFEVVGEAESGEESVERAHELSPDLVLMDVNLPGINGLEATRRILAQGGARSSSCCFDLRGGGVRAQGCRVRRGRVPAEGRLRPRPARAGLGRRDVELATSVGGPERPQPIGTRPRTVVPLARRRQHLERPADGVQTVGRASRTEPSSSPCRRFRGGAATLGVLALAQEREHGRHAAMDLGPRTGRAGTGS